MTELFPSLLLNTVIILIRDSDHSSYRDPLYISISTTINVG